MKICDMETYFHNNLTFFLCELIFRLNTQIKYPTFPTHITLSKFNFSWSNYKFYQKTRCLQNFPSSSSTYRTINPPKWLKWPPPPTNNTTKSCKDSPMRISSPNTLNAATNTANMESSNLSSVSSIFSLSVKAKPPLRTRHTVYSRWPTLKYPF